MYFLLLKLLALEQGGVQTLCGEDIWPIDSPLCESPYGIYFFSSNWAKMQEIIPFVIYFSCAPLRFDIHISNLFFRPVR